MSRKIFPETLEFHLFDGDKRVSTMHVTMDKFEEMAASIREHALTHAKLAGRPIKAFFAGADEPVLNAYPQGYTEVYR